MSDNRRRSERHPVGFYVDQFVNDQTHRCFTTDLSAVGMYMERLIEPIDRASKVVQLEILLPTAGDSIWACGRREGIGGPLYWHGTHASTLDPRMAA